MVSGLQAQQSDFIVIKKKDRPVKTFFRGSMAQFRTVAGGWYNGRIENISNDSIFFREVIVQQVPTPWGVTRLDTMTTFVRKIHYQDIVAIPRSKESFGYIRNGTLFMIGGAGYIGINIVNSAYQKYPPFGRENRPSLLQAAGVFAVGKLLQKTYKKQYIIGKKYNLRYIKA